jgi:hypothetical protein
MKDEAVSQAAGQERQPDEQTTAQFFIGFY